MNTPLVITILCASQLRQMSILVINSYVINFMSSLPPAPIPGNRGKCHMKQTDFSTLRDEAILTPVTRVQCSIPGQMGARPSRKSRCRKLMLQKWMHVLTRALPMQTLLTVSLPEGPAFVPFCSLGRERSHRLGLPWCPLCPLEPHGQACEGGTNPPRQ